MRFQLLGKRYEARVVGVGGEVRHDWLDRPVRAEMFLPQAQTQTMALARDPCPCSSYELTGERSPMPAGGVTP